MSSSTFFALLFIFLMARRGGLLRLLVVIFGCCLLMSSCVPAYGQALPAPDGISSLTVGPLTLSSTSPTGVYLAGPQALAVALYDPTRTAGGCDSVRLRVFVTGPASVATRSAVRAPLDTPATLTLPPVPLSMAGRYECLVVAVFYPRGNLVGVAAARTFYLDNAGAQPLPVTLASFTVTGTAATVRLLWTSAVESQLNHYEAQVSTTGAAWATVGAVAARGAGTYEQLLPAPAGLSYYRLRAVNSDGTSTYSATRAWSGAGAAAELVTVAGQHLSFAVRAGEVAELVTIYDYTGRRRWAGTAAAAAALPLAVGSYIVVLSTAQGGRYVARLMQL